MAKFEEFLINEEKSFFGDKINNVLTSMQDVQNDMSNLGSRHLSRLAENIVNQIRKILHGHWNPKYNHKLKELQKIAVAIQKTIDDRGDLNQVLPAATAALEQLSGKMGIKANNLKAPEAEEGEDIQPQDFQQTPETNPSPPDGVDPNMNQMPPQV
jgi:hypothetical protein